MVDHSKNLADNVTTLNRKCSNVSVSIFYEFLLMDLV